MNRKELAVTIVGLIATFCLPWPSSEEPQFAPARRATLSIRYESQAGTAALRPSGTFERVPFGMAPADQPTR